MRSSFNVDEYEMQCKCPIKQLRRNDAKSNIILLNCHRNKCRTSNATAAKLEQMISVFILNKMNKYFYTLQTESYKIPAQTKFHFNKNNMPTKKLHFLVKVVWSIQ